MSENWDARGQDLMSTPLWRHLAEKIGPEKCKELIDRAVLSAVLAAKRSRQPLKEEQYAEELIEAYEQAGLGTLEPEQAEALAAEQVTAIRLLIGQQFMQQQDEHASDDA